MQQGARVWMQRLAEDPENIACLDHISGIKHHHLVAKLCNDAQVMGNIKDGCLHLVPQFPDKPRDLRFESDVQSRGRLVRDQKGRIGLQSQGDHDPLAHAARKLVRESSECFSPRPESHPVEHVDGTLTRGAAVDGLSFGGCARMASTI